jgi:hypothetical protein
LEIAGDRYFRKPLALFWTVPKLFELLGNGFDKFGYGIATVHPRAVLTRDPGDSDIYGLFNGSFCKLSGHDPSNFDVKATTQSKCRARDGFIKMRSAVIGLIV